MPLGWRVRLVGFSDDLDFCEVSPGQLVVAIAMHDIRANAIPSEAPDASFNGHANPSAPRNPGDSAPPDHPRSPDDVF